MPEPSFMCPAAVIDLGNQSRLDEDCILPLAPRVDCLLRDPDRVHLPAKGSRRLFIEAGPYPAHVNQPVALARRHKQSANAAVVHAGLLVADDDQTHALDTLDLAPCLDAPGAI